MDEIFELTGECPGCGEQLHHEFKINNYDKAINYLYGTSNYESLTCDECGDKFDVRANMTIEFDLAWSWQKGCN